MSETDFSVLSEKLSDLPVPNELPQIDESEGYVLYGDRDNLYETYLDLYHNSPTNKACIDSIIDRVYGRGLSVGNAEINASLQAKLLKLMSPADVKRTIVEVGIFSSYAVMVVKAKATNNIASIKHWRLDTLRPGVANSKGEITTWYYSPDWSRKDEDGFIPKPFPAFGFEGSAKESIHVGIPYVPGSRSFYFAPTRYWPSLAWAAVEKHIGEHHLSNLQNGMLPSMMFHIHNQGTLTAQQKKKHKEDILANLQGTGKSGVAIFEFLAKGQEKTEITPIESNGNDEQFSWLSEQSAEKILIGHKVPDPALIGIPTENGLNNNADQLQVAEQQFMLRTIRPIQDWYIDDLSSNVLSKAGITGDLYFVPLTDEDEEEKTEITSARTGEELSAIPEVTKDDLINELLALGEDIDTEQWEEIESAPVDYEKDDELNAQLLNDPVQLSTGTANPRAKSEQDGKSGQSGDIYLVRYRYAGNASPDRKFCKAMMGAGKVYRKEDIVAMENKAVNAGFGPNGASTYSIWLYKGGARCNHYWERVIFKGKAGMKPDPKSPNAKKVTTSQARSEGFRPEANALQVPVKPINMKNRGFINPPSAKDIQPGV